jgi:hypothetical protein
MKREELELRRLEIEVENAETLQKSRAAEALARAELKQKQREWGAIARERRREKALKREERPVEGAENCVVCKTPGEFHSTAETAWHIAGHREGVNIFSM